MAKRSLKDSKDGESALTLAQLAMTIYYKTPFIIGPTYCWCQGAGNSPMGLSRTNIPGSHWELSDEMLTAPKSLFFVAKMEQNSFDEGGKKFFKNVTNAYVNKCDKRWTFAAIKYMSGITQMYAHDAVLDFSISLEALLNIDKESISLKLRFYTALLIGETYAERDEIQKNIKKFYKLRSTFVHGNFSEIGDEQLLLIKNVGGYISKLLQLTCEKKIENEILPELEYMILLGAPKYIKEKCSTIVTEKDIIEAIEFKLDLGKFDSYEFILSDDDDEYKYLMVKIIINGKEIELIDADYYMHFVSKLKDISDVSYWLSKDDTGHYIYIVNFHK